MQEYSIKTTYQLEGTDTKITSNVFFNTEDETYCEQKFDHVMTGSQCDSSRQCLQGWSEQNETSNQEWQDLVSAIEKCEASEYFFHDAENPPTEWIFLLSAEGNIVKFEEKK